MGSRKFLTNEGFNEKGNHYQSYSDRSFSYRNTDDGRYYYDGRGRGYYSNPRGTRMSGGRPYQSQFDYERGTREDTFLDEATEVSEGDRRAQSEVEGGYYDWCDGQSRDEELQELEEIMHGMVLTEDVRNDQATFGYGFVELETKVVDVHEDNEDHYETELGDDYLEGAEIHNDGTYHDLYDDHDEEAPGVDYLEGVEIHNDGSYHDEEAPGVDCPEGVEIHNDGGYHDLYDDHDEEAPGVDCSEVVENHNDGGYGDHYEEAPGVDHSDGVEHHNDGGYDCSVYADHYEADCSSYAADDYGYADADDHYNEDYDDYYGDGDD